MAKKAAASRGRTKKRKSQQTAVAVEQRIRQDRNQNDLRRQAEHVVADAQALKAETTASQAKPLSCERSITNRLTGKPMYSPPARARAQPMSEFDALPAIT